MNQSESRAEAITGAECPAAILIVSYNGRELLADCLASIFADEAAPAGQADRSGG